MAEKDLMPSVMVSLWKLFKEDQELEKIKEDLLADVWQMTFGLTAAMSLMVDFLLILYQVKHLLLVDIDVCSTQKSFKN
jgi:hypothetical protein